MGYYADVVCGSSPKFLGRVKPGGQSDLLQSRMTTVDTGTQGGTGSKTTTPPVCSSGPSWNVWRPLTTEDGQIPGYGPLEVHYTIYEGDPNVFVTEAQCPDAPSSYYAEGYEVCDELGWCRSMSGPTPDEDPDWDAECPPYLMEIQKRKAKGDPLIRAELERLEALWET